VAHFIGVHAGQALPLAGWALVVARVRWARTGVWLATALWTAAWALALGLALHARLA
jgi:hypothetical protein